MRPLVISDRQKSSNLKYSSQSKVLMSRLWLWLKASAGFSQPAARLRFGSLTDEACFYFSLTKFWRVPLEFNFPTLALFDQNILPMFLYYGDMFMFKTRAVAVFCCNGWRGGGLFNRAETYLRELWSFTITENAPYYYHWAASRHLANPSNKTFTLATPSI